MAHTTNADAKRSSFYFFTVVLHCYLDLHCDCLCRRVLFFGTDLDLGLSSCYLADPGANVLNETVRMTGNNGFPCSRPNWGSNNYPCMFKMSS
jgi:hypothetical protein